jgi:hypothetical protein
MTQITLGPDNAPDRLEKLEREYKNLQSRCESLEKQRSTWLSALVTNVLLLLLLAFLFDYMGYMPSAVNRLPVKAQSVDADEFILRGPNGKPALKILVAGQEPTLIRYDANGVAGKEEPLSAKR